MKKLATLSIGLSLLATSGCVTLGHPAPVGFFYTGVKAVSSTTQAEVTDGVRPGPKAGKACASGVLGMAAWGDMSIDAAKKSGGITRVDTVDWSMMSIIGPIYVKNCTLITGE